ncbi:MAG: hypothetical protein P4N60_01250 [Verrucomicrobiae bacterium]|nr:hypothetical protein [Verrucomicrobiae bacterium]
MKSTVSKYGCLMYLGGIITGIGLGFAITDSLLVPAGHSDEFRNWFHGWFVTCSASAINAGILISSFAWRNRSKPTL